MAKVVLGSWNSKINNEDKVKRIMWLKVCLINAVLIVFYLIVSISLTFYQRNKLQVWKIPLLVVCSHTLLKFIISSIFRWLWYVIKNHRRVTISWNNNIMHLAPPGIAGGIDLAFSNWGLEMINVPMYTMTKSTSICFILIFALIFRLEKKGCCVFMIVFMIGSGLFMFTYQSADFVLKGFLLVLFASLSSGVRWTLSQIILQQDSLGIRNPIDMMFYIQPWMFSIVVPFIAVFEGSKLYDLLTTDDKQKWEIITFMLIGGGMGFLVETSEYLVVTRTSSLTLAVTSVFKEALTLLWAIVYKKDHTMTWINGVGLVVCFCGIVMHVIYKARTTIKETYNRDLVTDESSALFLPFEIDSSEERDEMDEDESSTEVLFSVLQNRDWNK